MSVNDKGKYQFTMPKNNVKVTAVFEKKQSSIVRVSGDTRFATAAAISKKTFTKADTVVLTYGYNYADALSVSTVAAIKGAPIVYLPKDGELDADTAAYFKSIKGSVKKAYVIGGKSIISDSVKNKASNALGLKSVQRIAGDDRYLTCLKVNETFKDLFTGSIVCAATGTNFPDALAGGVYAAKNKAPLLLVNTAADDLSKEQLSWLKAKDAKQVTVFGGTNSVSDKHAEKIAKARV